jgi:small subunit ribosomal protein S16
MEHTKKTTGRFLELLGSYNPHQKELQVKKERIEYWLSKGAQLSATANNLLINNKILTGDKKESWKPKAKATEPAEPEKKVEPKKKEAEPAKKEETAEAKEPEQKEPAKEEAKQEEK